MAVEEAKDNLRLFNVGLSCKRNFKNISRVFQITVCQTLNDTKFLLPQFHMNCWFLGTIPNWPLIEILLNYLRLAGVLDTNVESSIIDETVNLTESRRKEVMHVKKEEVKKNEGWYMHHQHRLYWVNLIEILLNRNQLNRNQLNRNTYHTLSEALEKFSATISHSPQKNN